MLTTQVFVAFEPVRVRIVTTPVTPTNGSAQVNTKGRARVNELTPPFALIARIRHDSAAQRFSVQVDGQVVCDSRVAGGQSRRVDCVLMDGWKPQGDHEVTVRGPMTPWTLEYFELATHHGASRAYDLLILPAASTQYTRLSPGWIAFAWIALTFILLLPAPASTPRWAGTLYRALGALIVLFFILTLLSRLVSPYAVLVSRTAFIRLLCVLLAPQLWFAGRWLLNRDRQTGWVRPVACGLVAALVLAVYGIVAAGRLRDDHRGNYSGFLQISRAAFDRNPIVNRRSDVRQSLVLPEAGGYDAQFMYFATFDPFMRLYKDHPATYREFIDAPPYRFGRIGFSLLTKLFSGDRWQLYPATMVWLILSSLFLCGLALALTARAVGATPWWGALTLLIPGFWQSLQVALPEPIAAATLFGGCLCVTRSRWAWAGLLFALSLLIRETGAILVVCVATATLLSGRRPEAIRLAAISLAPLAVWRLYIGGVLFPDWGIQAFLFNPSGVEEPFTGILELWSRIHSGQYFPGVPELSRAGIWYPILVAGGLVLAGAFAVASRDAISIAAVLYGGIAISLSYASVWVHVGNAQRVTYEIFVMLALLSVGIHSHPRTLQVSVLTYWAAAAAFVFFGAHDAQYIRDTVLWPVHRALGTQ